MGVDTTESHPRYLAPLPQSIETLLLYLISELVDHLTEDIFCDEIEVSDDL